MAFWFDPKYTHVYKIADKWAFTEARIDGYLIDFEGFVNEDTWFSSGTKNQVRGIVGD